MFWSDEVASQLKKRNLPLEWVDDMKTPSGKVHVGSLFGVVFHDLVYKSLSALGVQTKYTYLFENHDPMDDIPSYLPYETYEKYLGMPLFAVPSPEEGYSNFAEYYGLDFKRTFNALGTHPEIIWTKDLYTSGKMNLAIQKVLDNAQIVREIYQQMYKKEMPKEWYPFQVYCEHCGKVSTTSVYDWDGTDVSYRCKVDAVKWTKGCGYEGKTSPFSSPAGMKGKMPWKVEWPCKWQAVGVTVEGAGKDHMSKGGSHDFAQLVCERVIDYPVPYPVSYEFMLIGGKKMSSSKGRGFSASDILTILPARLARFLIVKMDIKQQTNFDPTEPNTIPTLFDEYQKAADAYFSKTDPELARVFELSQIGEVQKPPAIRFSVLAQWVQMPNMQQKITDEGLEEWATYARIWVEQYARESDRFAIQQSLPAGVASLTETQKKLLTDIAASVADASDAEVFQTHIYDMGKALGLSGKETFAAIYQTLLGKDHGPKAAWLILSLDKAFVTKRFEEAARSQGVYGNSDKKSVAIQLDKPDVFSIDTTLTQAYPSLSVGIALIEGVQVQQTLPALEKEKDALLEELGGLTTEQLGQFVEVQSYRKLYKEMGVDWHSRRPSPEALLRRVALHKGLYTINTCVDAYNLVVMKKRVSVGAFDADSVDFPTTLRLAREGERILLLGDSEETAYKPTEIAYFDKKGGYNMDFNYRDAKRTAVTHDTKNVYVNVDGIYAISPDVVQEVLREACDKIVQYCGGKITLFGVVK